jgi:hypothetical protein
MCAAMLVFGGFGDNQAARDLAERGGVEAGTF